MLAPAGWAQADADVLRPLRSTSVIGRVARFHDGALAPRSQYRHTECSGLDILKDEGSMAREFSCRCGETLRGKDDDELFTAVRRHADEKHPEMGMSDDRVRQGIQTMARDVS